MIFQNIILIIILSVISASDGYRFLAIFPFPGRSHFHVLAPIAKSLAQRGHQIDVMSQFKLEEPFPNYKDLEFPIVQEHARLTFNDTKSRGNEHEWINRIRTRICDMLGHPAIKKIINNPPKNPAYDALIIHVATGIQCLTAIGYMLDIPIIGVATSMVYPSYHELMGNPLSLAIAPGRTNYYTESFTFWERVVNVVCSHMEMQSDKKLVFDLEQQYLTKYLGLNISKVEKNVDLLLTNSHYSFHGIRPKVPAIIEIGGINIKNDTSELKPSLKKILDGSTNGFIYVSFGTLTAVETLPSNFLNQLFDTFCKVSPIRIIMKLSSTDFGKKNLCDNVFLYDWLPQQKLLGHPNIKAFVSHGGGLSSQETIHYAVPIICIPVFFDQSLNCDIFASKDMGVKIDIRTAQPSDYDYAFQKVLSNSHYKESMKKLSKLYWDRPQSPQEAVIYWVEYVMRHGKNALRSPALDLEWYQVELIDVYCFLFSCIFLAVILSITIVWYTLKFTMQLFSSSNTIPSSKKIN